MANFWSDKEEEVLSNLVKSSKDKYSAYLSASKILGRTYEACSMHWSYMKSRSEREGVLIKCVRKNSVKPLTLTFPLQTQSNVKKFEAVQPNPLLDLVLSKLSQKSLLELAKTLKN